MIYDVRSTEARLIAGGASYDDARLMLLEGLLSAEAGEPSAAFNGRAKFVRGALFNTSTCAGRIYVPFDSRLKQQALPTPTQFADRHGFSPYELRMIMCGTMPRAWTRACDALFRSPELRFAVRHYFHQMERPIVMYDGPKWRELESE